MLFGGVGYPLWRSRAASGAKMEPWQSNNIGAPDRLRASAAAACLPLPAAAAGPAEERWVRSGETRQ